MLGVGNLVIFSFVYIVLGIMVNMPPLACVGPEYLLFCFVVLLELLYMILYSCSWRSMYDVDFIFGILVSWMNMTWGLGCNLFVSSWMPGRLVLILPAFHVINFNVWVGKLLGCVWLGGVLNCDVVRVLGWYPCTGCEHLTNSCIIFGGKCGISILRLVVVMGILFAILSLMLA